MARIVGAERAMDENCAVVKWARVVEDVRESGLAFCEVPGSPDAAATFVFSERAKVFFSARAKRFCFLDSVASPPPWGLTVVSGNFPIYVGLVVDGATGVLDRSTARFG